MRKILQPFKTSSDRKEKQNEISPQTSLGNTPPPPNPQPQQVILQ